MAITKSGPYGGEIHANYPRDQWWVAATSDEIGREPKQRWILDYPVVLYRKQDGGVVALDDRCPHRWAPLSKGWLEGDDIVCGYHGFRYCPQGDCVKVPTQEQPARAKVKSYPVIEQGPLVWIWTGDPARCHDSAPPDLPWLYEPGWSRSKGYMEVGANYMLLKENVLDLTHFGFLHRATFGIFDWNRAPDVKVENGQVTFRLDFPPGPLTPYFAELTGFGDRAIAQIDLGRYVTAALQDGGRDFIDPDPQPGKRETVRFRILHATTPISPTRMHYFWFVAFDVPLTTQQIDSFAAGTLIAFEEDKAMLTAIQQMIERDPRGANYPEIMVATDRPPVQARRVLLNQLESERARGNANTAPGTDVAE